MEYMSISTPLISFCEFRAAYASALKRWLNDDKRHIPNILLSKGFPALHQDNIEGFIKWAFLTLTPELPTEYFLETQNAIWAISGSDCICWKVKGIM